MHITLLQYKDIEQHVLINFVDPTGHFLEIVLKSVHHIHQPFPRKLRVPTPRLPTSENNTTCYWLTDLD